ncbi:MAG: DUF4118 domain-containing protein [Anaerolineae bacterium]|nr:DUF4118 domain-containing protein [Anaerolineae bacterium]
MSTLSVKIRNYVLTLLLVAIATISLSMLRLELNIANFSLVYLLVVLIVAIRFGTAASLLAAFVSFLCFNYFLVEPLHTFIIANPRDLIDLFIYLAAATLTGQLASYARRQATTATQRLYEQNILYELTRALNQATDATQIHGTLKQTLANIDNVKEVMLLSENQVVGRPAETTQYLLLSTGTQIFGSIAVTFRAPPSESLSRLIVTCVVQTATALQRIDLTAKVQQSRTFEEADRLKTALLRAVSHDLRTPLTIIKTSASNLQRLDAAITPTDRADMIEAIEVEADHLNEMVGDLLDISRLQAGALQINAEWNSLEEAAGDVAARIYQRFKQQRLRLDFPADMPAVRFDYGLILQTLSNLVENSLRYEPPDKQVIIEGRVINHQQVQIAVVNHGPTIPASERQAVMEPFYHGKGGQTGLGLAIAKGIVEAHHGELHIEDTKDGGVTFIFTLPLEPIYDQNTRS